MEKRYDVFISVKNTDDSGARTKDLAIAEKLYESLEARGLNVFLSTRELAAKGAFDYFDAIAEALDTSANLVAVGCSKEHLESRWVKSEWQSFLNEIRSERKPGGRVFVLLSNMSVADLPYDLRQVQAFSADEADHLERLQTFIGNAGFSEVADTNPQGATSKLITAKDSITDNTYTVPADARDDIKSSAYASVIKDTIWGNDLKLSPTEIILGADRYRAPVRESNAKAGMKNSKKLKEITPFVKKIERLENEYIVIPANALQAKTGEFKSRLRNGESLDDLLPEAFAAMREACDRVLGMRPNTQQLIGGIALHQGRVAEIKPGEGKTLAAVLPSFLNALSGKGVHVVTVNDYLARRDSERMGRVYRFMGLSVGLIVNGLENNERREAYSSDITYGARTEFIFDYLRDNLVTNLIDAVQRGHAFAIIDEADSILIDDARTPVSINDKASDSTYLYTIANDFVMQLEKSSGLLQRLQAPAKIDQDSDYIVDSKKNTATLTDRGVAKAERHFSVSRLADGDNSALSKSIDLALRAHAMMSKNTDYVVRNGKVVILSETTGQPLPDRRYTGGLHQAIEAKEGLTVTPESPVLTTITILNYFRMYAKLSGMAGVALMEVEKFDVMYGLDVVEIPLTHPNFRTDHPDTVFRTEEGKYSAIVNRIVSCHRTGQPVLVGAVSTFFLELLSSALKKRGITHTVLNAINHEREAEIIAQAGRLGAVTVMTNTAGLGTDVILGGNAEYLAKADMRKAGYPDKAISEASGYSETGDSDMRPLRQKFAELLDKHRMVTSAEAQKVKELGGLYIVGAERREERRFDDQLRDIAGRRGDPGETRFYLAMDDSTMKLFGGEKIMDMMDAVGLEDDTPIEKKMLTNAIVTAQRRVSNRYFQSTITSLEYDDVMERQRAHIYDQRRRVLSGEDLQRSVRSMILENIESNINLYFNREGIERIKSPAQLDGALAPFEGVFLQKGEIKLPETGLVKIELDSLLKQKAKDVFAAREQMFGAAKNTGIPVMRDVERYVMLRCIDGRWREHISAMEELLDRIRARAGEVGDPINEYKNESMDLYEVVIGKIKEEVIRRVYTVKIGKDRQLSGGGGGGGGAGASAQNVNGEPVRSNAKTREGLKTGRNDPCPCGKLGSNGLPMKYKNCCGRSVSE